MDKCVRRVFVNVKDKVLDSGVVKKSIYICFDLGYCIKSCFAGFKYEDNLPNISEMLGLTIKEVKELKEGQYDLLDFSNNISDKTKDLEGLPDFLNLSNNKGGKKE